MIPSDHFVRYYNEVFKALEQRGLDHLVRYWQGIGELQKQELAESFRKGGLQACHDYWARILKEENCVGHLTLTPDYFELRMDSCPSLSTVCNMSIEGGARAGMIAPDDTTFEFLAGREFTQRGGMGKGSCILENASDRHRRCIRPYKSSSMFPNSAQC